ncbi:heme ABC exporter ATP-binding protein CcmA [Gammaproteobacteria bacterium]|nr:heme ABC exporter ATP-binding protein CcmA [Gammaproteobacteria bacterium]
MSNILKVQNLNCRRSGEEVLQGLSFTLEAGKNLEIIGSNGSGKTTILRSLLGFANDHDGEVYWNDSEVPSTFQEEDVSCFYQGHQIAVKPLLTTYENLKFSSSGFNSSLEEIILISKKIGLKDFLNRQSSSLSAGQRKRIAIGRWLLKDFNLYMIDEPFTALDDEGIELIESIVRELNNKGASFLITGHRPSGLDSNKIHLDFKNDK